MKNIYKIIHLVKNTFATVKFKLEIHNICLHILQNSIMWYMQSDDCTETICKNCGRYGFIFILQYQLIKIIYDQYFKYILSFYKIGDQNT